ncbi:hypothetical protein D3C79_943650 [compost metagenome]
MPTTALHYSNWPADCFAWSSWIEVRLAYRLGLADALALPGQPRTMLHDDWAGVGPQQLEQARLQVLADEQGEALQKFVCSRDFWQDFLRRK